MDISTTSLTHQDPVNNLQAAIMPFRFLDLPAEMRNRIYDCVADLIEEAPILLANSRKARKETAKTYSNGTLSRHQRVLRDLAKIRKLTNRRHVLGLLLVCRQITNEARAIIEEAVGRGGLDLRFMMLNSSLRKMEKMRQIWKPKMQLVKHLTVDHSGFGLFAFARKKSAVHIWELFWRMDYDTKGLVKSACQLRKLLSNIESMTVYTMSNNYDDDLTLHCGEMVAARLASILSPHLPKIFPRLVDIKCLSEFDGERFKNENGVWQSWYNGERVSP